MVEGSTGAAAAQPLVLVIGATGYLGQHIVAQLRRAGYRVRAVARDPQRLGFTMDDGVEVFVGQVTQPETLVGLCDGVSIVVSALGVRSLKRRPTPLEVDYQGNLNVLRVAQQAHVDQFIFVGVLHAERLATHISVLEPRERFITALRQSEIPWTVIRAPGFFNDMEIIFNQARRGGAYLFGNGQARINPIHPTDIADELTRSIANPTTLDRTFEIGGPETFTYDQVAQLAFQALGKRPRITHLPPAVLAAASLALAPFNPTAAGFLSFFHAVMTSDFVATPVGHIHLRDDFAQLAGKRSAEEQAAGG